MAGVGLPPIHSNSVCRVKNGRGCSARRRMAASVHSVARVVLSKGHNAMSHVGVCVVVGGG